MTSFFQSVSIEPQTGLLCSCEPHACDEYPQGYRSHFEPRLVVGSFILAASGLPSGSVRADPAVWSQASDLSGTEAMGAAILGTVFRVLTAIAMALFITPLLT